MIPRSVVDNRQPFFLVGGRVVSSLAILKRTFNQDDGRGGVIRYWRVVGPAWHPNLNSDLSLEGLKEWGIL